MHGEGDRDDNGDGDDEFVHGEGDDDDKRDDGDRDGNGSEGDTWIWDDLSLFFCEIKQCVPFSMKIIQ